MHNLQCPQCMNSMAPADTDENATIARCNRCGKAFTSTKSSATTLRAEASIPKGISAKYEEGHLLIVRRWFQPRWIVFLFAGLILLVIGAFTLPKVLPTLTIAGRFGIFLPFLTPVVLFYFGLCKLLNRTEIRIDGTWLDIRHVPLPLSKSVRVDTALVDQFYSVRQFTSPKSPPAYAVVMVMKSSGKRQRLLSGIENEAQAAYLAQEINCLSARL